MVRLRPTTTTLSTRDARALASFYERLLGWERGSDEAGWVTIGDPTGGHRLGFHHDEHYRELAEEALDLYELASEELHASCAPLSDDEWSP